jgi:hypothetical protein
VLSFSPPVLKAFLEVTVLRELSVAAKNAGLRKQNLTQKGEDGQVRTDQLGNPFKAVACCVESERGGENL